MHINNLNTINMENTTENWKNCAISIAKSDSSVVTNRKTCSGSVIYSCRLCLKEQDELRIDIFAKSEINNKTNSLAEHLFDLLKVKYENYPPLPQGICDNCIFMVEAFTNFRDNVKTRETELLHRYKELRMKYMHSTMDYNEQEIDLEADDSYEVIDVNVEQDYESSDDDFSLESENETETNEIMARAPEQETKNDRNDDLAMHSSISHANSLATQHTEIVSNRTLCYLCQYCDMAFTTQPACFEHETKFHDSSLPFCCNYCQLRVNKRQTLISHIKHQHQADRPYICSLCGKSFCRRSDLKKHTIVHTGVRPYTCGLCAKNFSRNTNLTKHMRIHNSLKPHVCQLCPRSFSTVQELDVHTRSHNDNKAYQCEQCPASYSRRDKLHKHKLSHLRWQKEQQFLQTQPTDVQLEAQPLTEKSTTYSTYHDQSNFVANILQQQPMGSAKHRSFNCNFCTKTFSRQQDFQRHQGLHLDDLFMCKICNEGFSRQEKLIRHVNEYHKPEFKCNICNISFAQNSALELHMKIQHLQRQPVDGNNQLSEHEVQPMMNSELLPKQETNANQAPSFDELSYNSKMIPTMNLGFYSETPSAS